MQTQSDKQASGLRRRSGASKDTDNLASSAVLPMNTNASFPNFSWEISNQGPTKPVAGSKQVIPSLEGHGAYAIAVWKT